MGDGACAGATCPVVGGGVGAFLFPRLIRERVDGEEAREAAIHTRRSSYRPFYARLDPSIVSFAASFLLNQQKNKIKRKQAGNAFISVKP